MHNEASLHNHSGPKNGNGNGGSSNQNRSNTSTPAKRDLSHITCFKCQNTGHYANDCPKANNGNGNGGSARKPNPFTKGQVNHISVEEIEDESATIPRWFW